MLYGMRFQKPALAIIALLAIAILFAGFAFASGGKKDAQKTEGGLVEGADGKKAANAGAKAGNEEVGKEEGEEGGFDAIGAMGLVVFAATGFLMAAGLALAIKQALGGKKVAH
ncbi:hypothetical protein FJZ26_03040 [Candidatus Parvarchaeota archaeon]|nr:hypothetical protein [Candidatus Parvarchaeota archaeon]